MQTWLRRATVSQKWGAGACFLHFGVCLFLGVLFALIEVKDTARATDVAAVHLLIHELENTVSS